MDCYSRVGWKPPYQVSTVSISDEPIVVIMTLYFDAPLPPVAFSRSRSKAV